MFDHRKQSVGSAPWLFAVLLSIVVIGGGAAIAGDIRWKNADSGTARAGAARSAGGPGSLALGDALRSLVPAEGSRHIVVRLGSPVIRGQRAALRAAGLHLLAYLGDDAFFATALPTLDVDALARIGILASAEPIEPSWKIHPDFAAGVAPPWSVVGDLDTVDPIVAAYVLFHDDVSLTPIGTDILARHAASVVSRLPSANGFVIELPLGSIPALVREDAVQWIEPPLPPLSGTNDDNRLATQVEAVQTDPAYGLDGTGVTVLVYDVGVADVTHPDFGTRLTPRDNSTAEGHATHVAGTIGGDGFASGGRWRGMAPGVRLESYGFQMPGGLQPGFLYTDPGDLEADYAEAVNVYGAQIASNSIGSNVCANGFDCTWTGDYGVTAHIIDAIVAGSLGAPVTVVWAAGNERGCDRCIAEGVSTPEGYRSMAPPSGAKNSICVGATNSNDGTVAAFSSRGPTDDGRLKPDLMAPGCQSSDDFGVTSTIFIGGYLPLCGTSMSAPTVTGSIALLLQDFRERFPGTTDPSNATIKALLAHGAADLGAPGPDYMSGYGALRALDTIDLVRGGRFRESAVQQDEAYSFLIEVAPADETLKVTLAWDDAPGSPNVLRALVNDLDLRVFDPSGTLHFPWTLDPFDPAAPAVRTRPDRLNNVEQVRVDAPAPGLWLVQILGYSVPEGPQAFGVSMSPGIAPDCDHDGTPDEEQLAADPDLDCSGNGIIDACEPDCDGDNVADSCAIHEGSSRDCNGNGVPDECEASNDCNANGTFDPCDVADGTSDDCDGNFVPDECEPDCNANGVADSCDIAAGDGEDCDRDGQPDECQPGADCNFNGLWDPCETAMGLADDFNLNGIPDECETQRMAWQVDAANCPGPGDGTVQNPFCHIQDAIDAATSGDAVILAPGVYVGPRNRNLDFRGRAITVRSVDPGDPAVVDATVIDCDGKGRGFHFHSGETSSSIVDGLTIRNGLATTGTTPGIFKGGGIYCADSHPTIRNCVITGGMAGPTVLYFFGGGGIYCERSSPLIEGCSITANVSHSRGGGVYCFDGSSPRIKNCLIADNISFQGAGIACGTLSSPVIENCRILDNLSLNSGNGGGITCNDLSHAVIRNSTITGNESGLNGGGVHCTQSSHLTIQNTTIAYNHAVLNGGGVYIERGSSPTIDNSIIWGNTNPGGPSAMTVSRNAGLVIDYSDVEGGELAVRVELGSELSWLGGNIDEDPLFEDPLAADWHLTADSPCVDRGDPRFIGEEDETDMDDEGRLAHCRVDIGADESPFFRDCNGNDDPDGCETSGGTATDCDADGVPDECQNTGADCDGNGIWDACDIADGLAEDCNRNLIRDDCELDGGLAADCNGNGVPDDCDIADGTDSDINDNGIPDGCEACANDGDCGDGVFCNGIEQCLSFICYDDDPPCDGMICVEEEQRCVNCVVDADCDDDNFCTGDACNDGLCENPPLAIACDDGEPCTVDEACFEGRCIGALIPGCGATYSLLAVAVDGVALPDAPTDHVTMFNNEVLTCELFGEGWDPSTLRLYTAEINSASYTGGSRGFMTPLVDPTPAVGAFIDQGRPDYVFFDLPRIAGVLNNDPSRYVFGGLVLFTEDCPEYAGTPAYMGTLVLTASPDAYGRFMVCIDDTDVDGDHSPEVSNMLGCDDLPVEPVGFVCVTIEVIADCNDNGIPDEQDIADGTSEDCTNNGFPDECEPDCDENGIADSCDLDQGNALDCNENTIPDVCDIASETSQDCNGNAIPDDCEPDCNDNQIADECDIADGQSEDCDDDGVPDDCQDCNSNGIGDVCELADGTTADCNANEIPDDCDIAGGESRDCDADTVPDECQDTTADCNENEIWDACDLADGTSRDCNENGLPDTCDLAAGTSRDCDVDGVPDECPNRFPTLLSPDQLDGRQGGVFHGIDEGDYAGRRVAGAGDVNSDGINDILIGAGAAEPPGREDTGEVYVLFGRTGVWESPLELSDLLTENGGDGGVGFIIRGIDDGDFAGQAVAGIGDFNADGIDDILVGAPSANFPARENAGAAYVIFGHPQIGAGGVIALADLDGADGFVLRGISETDHAGTAVSGAGDVNGDGVADIIIGARVATANGFELAGQTYVVFGHAGPFPAGFELANLRPENGGDGSAGFALDGIHEDDLSGSAVAGVGDINGDGYDDIAIGAYSADVQGVEFVGQAYLVFGGEDIGAGGLVNLAELDGENGVTFLGIDELDLAGQSVSAGGDLNHDGIADMLIGAVWADPGDRIAAGETYVIFGHTDPWAGVFWLPTLLPEFGGDGTEGFVLNGTDPGDYAGFATAGGADLNADGIDDIIVGAYGADLSESEGGFIRGVGEAYVLYGHEDPWPPAYELADLLLEQPPNLRRGFVIRGDGEGDSVGVSVAMARDVNGDGLTDMLVGAGPADVGNREFAGKSFVLFGRPGEPRDCNVNGVVDSCDIADGTSVDCDLNGIPDECEGLDSDCNENGLSDLCDVLDGTSRDCNGNRVPDECDLSGGMSRDCNENAIPDECESDEPEDCNGNGIWDACDVYLGLSEDCDRSGVPDECEPGGIQDCNTNGSPDLCDIYERLSADLNANAVPDECEPYEAIYVDTGGCDPLTGGSGMPDDPFCRIQDAIDSAGDGSISVIDVILADGVYVGERNRNLDFGGGLPEGWTRSIRVRGANGYANCVIDCAGGLNAFSFHRGETAGARIEDLTLLGSIRGAVECIAGSSPVIHRCLITRNSTIGGGAGVRCTNSSPTISHSTLAGNFIGGILSEGDSRPQILDCRIIGNHSGNGGGIRVADGSAPRIERCTIARNFASWQGGGVFSELSVPVVDSTILFANWPNELSGPAIVTFTNIRDDFIGRGNVHDDPLFVGGPIGSWTADGAYDPQTRVTTLYDAEAQWEENEWIGATVNPARNSEVQVEFVIMANTATTLTIRGDAWNLAEDGGAYQLFDYHMLPDSPAINAGNFETHTFASQIDLDGAERVRHCRVDMGAYESPYAVDCDDDGLTDACEAAAGNLTDCNRNWVPDVCDPDCDDDGVPDGCNGLLPVPDDINQNGIPDPCDMAFCDLNADGEVDHLDRRLMFDCLRSVGPRNPASCAAADVNLDGVVNDTDRVLFEQCYADFAHGSPTRVSSPNPKPPRSLR